MKKHVDASSYTISRGTTLRDTTGLASRVISGSNQIVSEPRRFSTSL